MYNKLLKISRRKNLPPLFIGIFFTIVSLFALIPDIKDIASGSIKDGVPITAETVQSLEGRYVSYTTHAAFNSFASLKKHGIENRRLYAVPVFSKDKNSVVLIALVARYRDYAKLDKLTEQTFNMGTVSDSYSTAGRLKHLNIEESELFDAYCAKSDFDHLPYAIYADSREINIMAIIMLIIGLIVTAAKCVTLYGLNEANLRTETAHIGRPDEIENDCAHGRITANDIFIGSTYVAFAAQKPVILRLEDVVWVYGHIVKYNFIFILTSEIIIKTAQGKQYSVAAKQLDFEPIMADLYAANRKIIRGYTKELSNLYDKDRSKFLELCGTDTTGSIHTEL